MSEMNLPSIFLRSCVVKANFKTPDESDSSCCGTIIDLDQGLTLSHGSLLTNHIAHNERLMNKIKNGHLLQKDDLEGGVFSLLVSKQCPSLYSNIHQKRDKLNGTLEPVTNSALSQKTMNKENIRDFMDINCNFVCAFRNEDFHKTIHEIMPSGSWTFYDSVDVDDIANSNKNQKVNQNEHNIGDSQEANIHLLSYFVLLKFNALNAYNNYDKDTIRLNEAFFPLPLRTRINIPISIGDVADIIATPFASLAPSVFFNAYSRGVVSNVKGLNDCWIVSDARCIPGSEGGPLYTSPSFFDKTHYLTGIIASSLCWKSNEWVGFSVACSIESILHSISSQCLNFIPKEFMTTVTEMFNTNNSDFKSPTNPSTLPTQAISVVVQCGATWGSGVIVDRDQGIILTCSHVLLNADYKRVTVSHDLSQSKHVAEVIYRQKGVIQPFDLAVVRCLPVTQQLPKHWRIKVSQPQVGSDVILSGYALFDTDLHLPASQCHGVISKVIWRRKAPVMIQTTCAVHPGASGGPLFKTDGSLLGIVVCNTRDAETNCTFPHVNLCIPASTIWTVIEKYLTTKDPKCLSQFEIKDDEIQNLWLLGSNTNDKLPLMRSKHQSKL